MMSRFVAILTLTLAVAGSAIPAGAQSARLVLDSDSMRVGETHRALLIAEYPAPFDLVVPEASESAPAEIGDFELHRLLGRSRAASYGGMIRDSLEFAVVTFALDTASTSGAQVLFASREDTLAAMVAPLDVPIIATYREGETPRDLAPIVDVPVRVWPWILGGIVVLIAGVVFIRWWRRRRDADGEEPAAEIRSPVEEARRRLQALSSHPMQRPDEQKAYAVELADILRTYLARRLGLPARERTTREIMLELQRHEVRPDAHDAARDVLTLSDRIKFARAEATEQILASARTETMAWIEQMERTLQHHASDVSTHSAVPE